MAEKQQQSCAVEASGVEGELISEIEELVSQFDPSGPNFEWKKKKACGIQEMVKAKFSSLQLHYGFEIFELREQIRNRNQHIQQLELALQEILEKYRQQIEAQGTLSVPPLVLTLEGRSNSDSRYFPSPWATIRGQGADPVSELSLLQI
jgi:hypothetical protein